MVPTSSFVNKEELWVEPGSVDLNAEFAMLENSIHGSGRDCQQVQKEPLSLTTERMVKQDVQTFRKDS